MTFFILWEKDINVKGSQRHGWAPASTAADVIHDEGTKL